MNIINKINGEERKTDVINFVKKISKIQNPTLNSPILYFDMKRGIEKSKWQQNEHYKMYWKAVLDEINFTYNESSDEVIISGFGDHLLRKISSFIQKKIENQIKAEDINEQCLNFWEDIGKLIYSYGCARDIKFC